MGKLTSVGRIYYGFAMAGLGCQAIFYSRFPYMMVPPKHSWIPGITFIIYLFGALLLLTGVSIVVNKRTRLASLILGSILLLIFILCFVPYQLIATSNYLQLVAWENAEKELALAAGAFVVAGCFSSNNESAVLKLPARVVPFGAMLFAITMLSFGIIHFQYANDVANYVPSWIPFRLFWAYAAGTGLVGCSAAIILKIKVRWFATILGAIILTWVIVLHIPRVIVSPPEYLWSEVTSALIALAYSGTAFVIAGRGKK
jgi:hypothetical protein